MYHKPPKRNLLLCFDAFGTLYKPRQPIGDQYMRMAKRHGLARQSVTPEVLEARFKSAFDSRTALWPNYGRGTGMTSEVWWRAVVIETFRPLLPADRAAVEEVLAPALVKRFATARAYVAAPGVSDLVARREMVLRRLKQGQGLGQVGKIVIGVISNSDERVVDVLRDFGLRVAPVRVGVKPEEKGEGNGKGEEYDVDFCCLSYDVGVRKPDPRIFEAAEELAREVAGEDVDGWIKVYVGNELRKDVVAAREAGWHGILLGAPKNAKDSKRTAAWGDVSKYFPYCPVGKVFPDPGVVSLGRAVYTPSTVMTERLEPLVDWLVGKRALKYDALGLKGPGLMTGVAGVDEFEDVEFGDEDVVEGGLGDEEDVREMSWSLPGESSSRVAGPEESNSRVAGRDDKVKGGKLGDEQAMFRGDSRIGSIVGSRRRTAIHDMITSMGRTKEDESWWLANI
ncbi:hypothetical protein B0T22DRAFT_538342 [Podospora appendiculata]|uniref:Haloacid dehalogenase n=1 Tax=Podospora appendiculata TaxID=314037 RepID=A0AAE0X6L8_9PEZI|nr:hypothetical protein B0T22DRAFT_538342 [Podospora appendiculata]